jgi:hypothetical protein
MVRRIPPLYLTEGRIKIEGIFDECKLYNTSLNEIVWPRLIERRY